MRCGGAGFEERSEFLLQSRFVGEGIIGRRLFDKEVEGIVNRHLDHEFHFNTELAHRLQKYKARIPIREGVLLPIDEMFAARDSL